MLRPTPLVAGGLLLLALTIFSYGLPVEIREPTAAVVPTLVTVTEPLTQPTEAPTIPSLPSTVTLAAAGDVMFDTFIYNWITARGVDYPWEDVAPLFQAADIALVNFESSCSTQGTSTKPEGYGFRSPPHTLEGLVNAGIDYVSLGNNHVLDYGTAAFADTLAHLTAAGIAHSGAGMNWQEAAAVTLLTHREITLGFISLNAIVPHVGWIAGEESPGIIPLHSPADWEKAVEIVAAGKELCDLLVVIPHWGIEYAPRPSADQRALAYRLIDAGADLILGGHPHVLQGLEFYREKPIFYSLGNFIFLKMDDDAGKSALFSLEIDATGFLSCTLYPIFIQDCKANLLAEENPMYGEILSRFSLLSAELGTTVVGNHVVKP
ncbi:MAG: CapA family protein [Symbiobacteriaceae bacterium]|nr:CapA family protein [Symbiobacteriaceae bacterium]